VYQLTLIKFHNKTRKAGYLLQVQKRFNDPAFKRPGDYDLFEVAKLVPTKEAA
jgi:hypothetical protein